MNEYINNYCSLYSADLPETDVSCDNALDAEEDSMGSTAITFILLFLITLLFTIGTTALKVWLPYVVINTTFDFPIKDIILD